MPTGIDTQIEIDILCAMTRWFSSACVSVFVFGSLGCADAYDVDASESEDEDDRCAEQLKSSLDGLPDDLLCTGLFKDLHRGKLGDGVKEFEPAVPLWSDGAEKTRWIRLPKGEQIDTSDPRGWRYPIGTKVWKEFRARRDRAETRMFQKLRSDRWARTTYIWNDKGTAAKRHDTGKQFTRDGVDYEVPASGKCDDCHDGKLDSVLGFDAVSLGLGDPDRDGWTLRKLIREDLLSDPPELARLEVGDDGTGLAAEVLPWLHVNCGVTCHNESVNAKAEVTGLRMTLDPAQLDGRPSSDFRTRKLLLNEPAVTEQWRGQKRIVPGEPDESLLYQLITTRVGMDSNKQMPPLATRRVDEDHAAMIRAWILALD